MVDDPNRKSPRSFQCRDALWDALEALASENEQSVDYLINEAVRTYLQAQGRSVFAPRHTVPPTPSAPKPPLPTAAAPRGPSIPKMPPMPGSPTANPARPSMPGPSMPSLPSAARHAPGPPPLAKPHAPPPMPSMGPTRAPPPGPPPMPARATQLYAVFEGSEYLVDKEEFYIGRGQKVCDIVIRDTNVSRQHAKVMKHNGAWWMLDNQSLNGVEFRGAKLQQKRIDDGDTFTVCGHPIQFGYR